MPNGATMNANIDDTNHTKLANLHNDWQQTIDRLRLLHACKLIRIEVMYTA